MLGIGDEGLVLVSGGRLLVGWLWLVDVSGLLAVAPWMTARYVGWNVGGCCRCCWLDVYHGRSLIGCRLKHAVGCASLA